MNDFTRAISRARVAALSPGVVAVLGLTLTGCASPASESREASLKLDVEVCFTNELATTPTQVSTTVDGSGTIWQATLRPGQTGCTHSKNSTYEQQGVVQPSGWNHFQEWAGYLPGLLSGRVSRAGLWFGTLVC